MPNAILSANDANVLRIADLIRGRRTTNLFEPEPVATEALLDAIELARWAPNHRLTEPWRFYVLGPKTVAAVIECWAAFESGTRGEAAAEARRKRVAAIPGHFVLTSARHEDATIDRENYAACCCAAQNLMLYLWQRGIGVKWTTGDITRQASFHETIGMDADSERLVGYFWYGQPKLTAQQKRKDLREFVSELP